MAQKQVPAKQDATDAQGIGDYRKICLKVVGQDQVEIIARDGATVTPADVQAYLAPFGGSQAGLDFAKSTLVTFSAALANLPVDFETLLNGAIDALRSMGPTDPMETMMMQQMLVAHHVSMVLINQNVQRSGALLPEVFAIAERSRAERLKQAASFMRLSGEHMKLLDRRRGRAAQRVRVEHVTIESGANAVLGDVHHTQDRGMAENGDG